MFVELLYDLVLVVDRHAFAEEAFEPKVGFVVAEEVDEHFEDYGSAAWPNLLKISAKIRNPTSISSLASLAWLTSLHPTLSERTCPSSPAGRT